MKNINWKKFLSSYLADHKIKVAVVIFSVIVAQLLANTGPYLYKLIIDKLTFFSQGQVSRQAAINFSIMILGISVGLSFLRQGFYALQLYYTNRVEAKILKNVGVNFVDKILDLSFEFHTQRKTGKIAKQFSRGIGATENILDTFVFNLGPNILELLIVVGIYLFFDWKSSVILLLTIFAFLGATISLNKIQEGYRKKSNKIEDRSNAVAFDAIMNAETVKYFNREAEEKKSYGRIAEKWFASLLKQWDFHVVIHCTQEIVTIIGSILIWTLSILRFLNGDFSLGDLFLMVTYLSRIYGPLYSLQHVYRRFRYSVVDLERMIKYFELTNEVKDRVGAKALKITNDTVTFEDITFAYDKDKSILNNISFTVPAGKKVALVGASGEGKSTIIKLLLRFYDPQKGKILIDGQDIKKIKQSSLRENIAIVPQETSLFNNTIAHNIAYGKLNAKPREIDEASQLSRLDRLVKRLKKGYKTIVGERGIKLSGGEKQRVAIARAMLKDAPILILDEATSSLDSQTESEIQKSLDELMKGKTTLIIAHRLSTVMKSDFIVVIKNGQVAEVGNHSELTKTGGLYNHLWQMQSQGYLK